MFAGHGGHRHRFEAMYGLYPGASREASLPAGTLEALVEREIAPRLPQANAKRWPSVSPAERAARIVALVYFVTIRREEAETKLTEEGVKLSADAARKRGCGVSVMPARMVFSVRANAGPAQRGEIDDVIIGTSPFVISTLLMLVILSIWPQAAP
jgi:hypothetical protein